MLRRSSRRSRRISAAFFAVIAVSGLILASRLMAPRQLEAVSRRVPDLDGNQPAIWISDHEAIVDLQTAAAVLNINSGARRPLPALQDAVERVAGSGDCAASASPDGKWVLVYRPWTLSAAQAVPVNGGSSVVWPPSKLQHSITDVWWMPGSDRWAFITVAGDRIDLHTLDADQAGYDQYTRLSPLPRNPPTKQTRVFGTGPTPTKPDRGWWASITDEVSRGVTADGRMIQRVHA